MTGLGVVVTVDSQPTMIHEGRVEAAFEPLDRPRLVPRAAGGFSGFVTFVGTEFVGRTLTGNYLRQHGAEHDRLRVSEYASVLAADLSGEWQSHDLDMGLWVFLAGAEAGEPVFYFVNNIGDMAGHQYVDLRREFRAVNDLDDNLVPRWAKKGETKRDVLGRVNGYLRNGSLEGIIEPFNAFNGLMTQLYDGRFEGFERFESIESYGALVRMRSEFLKRLFVRSKGLYRGVPPIHGGIHVAAVALDGRRWTIPLKNVDKAEPIA